jgi:hypothetical protein
VFHIHLVQHVFLYVTGPRTSPFEFKKLEDFATMGDVKKYGRQGLAELDERLQNASPYRLEEVIEIPWFSPPLKLKISVRQALTQAAMHSSLSSRTKCDPASRIGRGSTDDGFHRVAAARATGGEVGDSTNRGLTYSETLCSSFWARRTRSTEYGARRLGSW